MALLCATSSFALLVEYLPNYRIIDEDLLGRDNLALINQQGVNYQYQAITTNGYTYYIGMFNKTVTGSPHNALNYLVLHDSEDAAFDSGLQAIANHGGTLWVLENKENRNLYDFANNQLTTSDPNRMFWDLVEPASESQTIQQPPDTTKQKPINTLTKNVPNVNQHADFANYLLSQFGVQAQLPQPATLIALHNNRPKGMFGVAYIDEFGNTQVACEHDDESKNLYWLALADEKSISSSSSAINRRSQKLINQLCKTKKFNVVKEVAPVVSQGDGSLSIYMINHAPNWQYINIEIKAGKKDDKLDEQRAKTQQLAYIEGLFPFILNQE